MQPCPEDAPARAAAVCYRRGADGFEFLLVRTKYDSYKWTFPKGQVDPGETAAEAAAREAREESGATGRVDPAAVATYRYQMGRLDQAGWEVCVEAFLLEVDSIGARHPAEGTRDPTWFTLEDASARLAIGREADYAVEHQRVVKAALRALEQ